MNPRLFTALAFVLAACADSGRFGDQTILPLCDAPDASSKDGGDASTQPDAAVPDADARVDTDADAGPSKILPGTILVATTKSCFSNVPQESYPTGIIGVDPVTGAQSIVSIGGSFVLPAYIAVAPDHTIYVADLEAFGNSPPSSCSAQADGGGVPLPDGGAPYIGGAVIAIDPVTLEQRVVAKGMPLDGANGIAYRDGALYVTTEGYAQGTVHSLVRIDPKSGVMAVVTDGSTPPAFSVAVGVALGPAPTLWIGDEPGNIVSNGSSFIWSVDQTTGAQRELTASMIFHHLQDVGVDSAGTLYAMGDKMGQEPLGVVVRVDTTTGAQTEVGMLPADFAADGMAIGADGAIYVGAISHGTTPGSVLVMNPSDGATRTIASDGYLSLVEGMRVF